MYEHHEERDMLEEHHIAVSTLSKTQTPRQSTNSSRSRFNDDDEEYDIRSLAINDNSDRVQNSHTHLGLLHFDSVFILIFNSRIEIEFHENVTFA